MKKCFPRSISWPIRLVSCGLIAVSSLVCISCTNVVTNAAGVPIPDQSRLRTASTALGPGDVIEVNFPAAPEMNLAQKLRPDGRVSLPMVGDVQASGRSLPSFQSYLQGRYKKHLQDPKVVVSLKSVAAAVYVSGAVNQPGKLSLDRPMTALQAVMETGGFSPVADSNKAWVIRTSNGVHRRYNLNLAHAMSGRAVPFYLQPYDVVSVGQRMW